MLTEPTTKIPAPSDARVRALIRKMAGTTEVPPWVAQAIVLAYQSGRYDEAAAETFNMAFR